LFKYNKSIFRVDGNAVAAGAFAVFSLPLAYSYARFALGSA